MRSPTLFILSWVLIIMSVVLMATSTPGEPSAIWRVLFGFTSIVQGTVLMCKAA